MWEGVVSTKLDKDDPRSANYHALVSSVKDGCGTTMSGDCFLSQFEGKRVRVALVDEGETGAERIATERTRQLEKEGYTAERDDILRSGEIAWAAACYAAPRRIYEERRYAGAITFADPWPWTSNYDKRPRPSAGNYPEPEKATREQRIDLLTKAGALIAAEIDRLLRLPPPRHAGGARPGEETEK